MKLLGKYLLIFTVPICVSFVGINATVCHTLFTKGKVKEES